VKASCTGKGRKKVNKDLFQRRFYVLTFPHPDPETSIGSRKLMDTTIALIYLSFAAML
jgi:hypothetical protein